MLGYRSYLYPDHHSGDYRFAACLTSTASPYETLSLTYPLRAGKTVGRHAITGRGFFLSYQGAGLPFSSAAILAAAK